MERYVPHPRSRRTISDRVRRLISYAWIIGSITLPIAGAAALSQSGLSLLSPAEDLTHTVSAGETLSRIAARYDVTVEEIVAANGLADRNRIYVGQVLVIPQEAPAGGRVHTVQAGESLAMIGRRYGVSVDQIVAANGLADRNQIRAGQQLTIPGEGTSPSNESPDVSYTLRRGDSLYRVSLIFGVTVDDLLAANNLASPAAIYPGLSLRIPASGGVSPSAGADNSYTVAVGDTLASIAVKFGVTVDGIIAANGLTRADQIYVGQRLNLPEPGQTARPAPAQSAVNHRVVRGQTLYEIALRYSVTVHALAAANNISNPSRIREGQVLSIPSAQAGSSSVQYASSGEGLCVDAEPLGTGTGYFIRPTNGYVITQRFRAGHSGIDLALALGNPVYASDSGTVVFSGWNPSGYGNLVILDHGNGWRTYYAHMQAIYVGCGQWVGRGTTLGEIGSTGNSTGPHLHFEILRFGIAVNPTGYLRFP